MKRYLAVLVLSMVVVVSFGANLEVKSTDPDIGIGMKYSSPPNDSSILKSSESVSVLDSTKIGKEEKIESQEGVGKDVQIKESQEKKGGDKREGLIDESQPKKLPEERKKEGESVPVKPLMPESVPGEECDSSNKCTVENKLVACLRVPGNDSPDLSLLIKNTGANPLTVDISAPDFVSLEKTTVQLKPKEPNTVKVSISKETSNGTSIILKVKDSQCIIDITTLTSHNLLEKTDLSNKKSSITDIITRTPILYISIAAVLVIASVWTCVRFCRRNQSKDGAKYQKIEMELPIFSEGKGEVDGNNDRWDDGWGDSWDDEEAPKTPSIPVTPSLSSKGLASRKHTKDAWKD